MESIKRTKSGSRGDDDAVGAGFRSVNVLLRKELDLYACTPVQAYEACARAFRDDIVIVRREHGGPPTPASSTRSTRRREGPHSLIKELDAPDPRALRRLDQADLVFGSERIVRAAFDYAKDNGRRRVTAAHKANIMKFTDGLFLEVAQRGSRRTTPRSSSRTASSTTSATSLVSRPEEYDVIVLPNLYGDIVSDLGAGMIGGLGLAPGRQHRHRGRMFEATTAPRRSTRAQQGEPHGAHALRVLMLVTSASESRRQAGAGVANVIRKARR